MSFPIFRRFLPLLLLHNSVAHDISFRQLTVILFILSHRLRSLFFLTFATYLPQVTLQ